MLNSLANPVASHGEYGECARCRGSHMDRFAVDASERLHQRLRQCRVRVNHLRYILRQQLAALAQQQFMDQFGGVVADDMARPAVHRSRDR